MTGVEKKKDDADYPSHKCQYIRKDNRQCPRDRASSSRYCILHSNRSSDDVAEFERLFRQELASQQHDSTLDLEGFVIPIPFSLHQLAWPNLHGVSAVNTQFKEKADFSNATFMELANFSDARFYGDADFSDTEFQDSVNFSKATFAGLAVFTVAVFKGDADFSNITFNSVDFTGAIFEVRAVFDNAKFNRASFALTSFWHEAAVSFRLAKLHDAYFERIYFPWGTIFLGADLTGATFKGGSLDGVLFYGCTGLESCSFLFPSWSEHKGHWAVGDELYMHSFDDFMARMHDTSAFSYPNPNYNELERLYRELRVSYENRKNFTDAGQFHYGEMEMRRLNGGMWHDNHTFTANWFSRTIGSLVGWYWLISGYGERWRRALMAFICIIFLSTVAYAIGGFAIKTPNINQGKSHQQILVSNASTQTVQATPQPTESTQQVKLKLSHVGRLQHWTHTVGQSLIFSFRVALLRTDGFSQSLSPLTSVFILFEIISGPIVLALMGLAIGRQFKRH